jgi:predicted RNA methylase
MAGYYNPFIPARGVKPAPTAADVLDDEITGWSQRKSDAGRYRAGVKQQIDDFLSKEGAELFERGIDGKLLSQPDGTYVPKLGLEVDSLRAKTQQKTGLLRAAFSGDLETGDPTPEAVAAKKRLDEIEPKYRLTMERYERLKSELDRATALENEAETGLGRLAQTRLQAATVTPDDILRTVAEVNAGRASAGAPPVRLEDLAPKPEPRAKVQPSPDVLDELAANRTGGDRYPSIQQLTAQQTNERQRMKRETTVHPAGAPIGRADITGRDLEARASERAVKSGMDPQSARLLELASFRSQGVSAIDGTPISDLIAAAGGEQTVANATVLETMKRINKRIASIDQKLGEGPDESRARALTNEREVLQKLAAGKQALIDQIPTSERIKSALGSVLGGVAEIPAATLDFLAITAKKIDDALPAWALGQNYQGKEVDDLQTAVWARQIREAVQGLAPADPRLQQEFWSARVPNAIGSMLAFLGATAATKSPVVTPLVLGGATGGSAGYREAIDAGADEQTALTSMLLNTGVGFSEIIPIARMFNRLDKAGGGGLKRALIDAGIEGAEEWIQEFSQQTAGNAIARQLYDENRGLFDESLPNGNAGGVSGVLASLLMTAVGRVRGGRPGAAGETPTPTTPPTPEGGDSNERQEVQGQGPQGPVAPTQPNSQEAGSATNVPGPQNLPGIPGTVTAPDATPAQTEAPPAAETPAETPPPQKTFEFGTRKGEPVRVTAGSLAEATAQLPKGFKPAGVREVETVPTDNEDAIEAAAAQRATQPPNTPEWKNLPSETPPKFTRVDAQAEDIARRITEGNTEWSPEDLQFHQEHASLIESILRRSAPTAKPSSTAETLSGPALGEGTSLKPSAVADEGARAGSLPLPQEPATTGGGSISAATPAPAGSEGAAAPAAPARKPVKVPPPALARGSTTGEVFARTAIKAAKLKAKDKPARFLMEFANRLARGNRDALSKMEVHVRTQAEWDADERTGVFTPDSAGAYDPDTNTLYLNSDRLTADNVASVIVHESGHFAEQFALGEAFTQRQWESLDHWSRVKAKQEYDGRASLDEDIDALKKDRRARAEWVAMQFARVVRGETQGMQPTMLEKLKAWLQTVRDIVNRWVGNGEYTTRELDQKILEFLGYNEDGTKAAPAKPKPIFNIPMPMPGSQVAQELNASALNPKKPASGVSAELQALGDELFGTPPVPGEFNRKFDPAKIETANKFVALLVREHPDVRSRAALAKFIDEKFPKARPFSDAVFRMMGGFVDLDESGTWADVYKPAAPAGPAPAEKSIAERSVDAANALRARIKTGEKLDWREFFEITDQAFGGTRAAGTYTVKDAYDALELAINLHIANDGILQDGALTTGDNIFKVRQAVNTLGDIIAKMPTQTVRTDEQDQMQQFSTPPHFGYVANWVANLRKSDVYLEPSAGIAGLATFAKVAGVKQIVANELSDRRAALLKASGIPDVVTEHNAENLNAILDAAIRKGQMERPTVVVMNPPFSNAAYSGDRRKTMVGAQHVEEALKLLAPGGRLVAIVGEGMGFDRPTFRDWWKRIRDTYAVRANIRVDGKNYAKYGTTFDNRLLVIDKPYVGDSVAGAHEPVQGDVATFNELINLLSKGIRDERLGPKSKPESDTRPPAESAGTRGASTGRPEAGAGGNSAGTTTDVVGAGQPGASTAKPGGGKPGGPSGVRRPTGTDAGSNEGPAAPGGRSPTGGRRPAAGTGEQTVGDSGRPADSTAGAGRPDVALPESETVSLTGGEAQAAKPAAFSDSIFDDYAPRKVNVPGAKPHPSPLVESAAMASIDPPDVTYQPKLPKGALEGGAPSSAQVETVVYAGQAHQLRNPDGSRRGFFVGDGTGSGKGITSASIIADNFLHGRKKAVWLSASAGLIKSARGDFANIGMGDIDLVELSNIKAKTGSIENKSGVIFGTYTTLIGDLDSNRIPPQFQAGAIVKLSDEALAKLSPEAQAAARGNLTVTRVKIHPKHGVMVTARNSKGKEVDLGSSSQLTPVKNAPSAQKSRVDQLVEWFGKDYDGVIILDEAHKAGNAIDTEGGRGIKKASKAGRAVIELQDRLPNARVVYASATGATEVSNLAYATRLGLWGKGTQFGGVEDFINQISAAGISAMEIVARDMKALGRYIARSLSWKEVKFDVLEHPLSPEQSAIYDEIAEAWQIVLRNMNEALELTGGKDSPQAKQAARSAFFGAQQRFFNQILTAMHMPSVIADAKQQYDAGHALIFQLTNTNASYQERAIDNLENAEDLETMDASPRDILLQYLDKSFPTRKFETVTDDNGNEVVRVVVDDQGKPVEDPEALQKKQALMDRVATLRIPDNPLDMILNTFGVDNVAEATGRSRRVVQREDDSGNLKKVIERHSPSHVAAQTQDFAEDKRRIVVFSKAGGTGYSYHADKRIANQRKRYHYLVQAGWQANEAVQGLGRAHRSNQASAPELKLARTNLPGHRRFISTIARRLAQLGALTTGERRSTGQGLFKDSDNLENEYANAAVRGLYVDAFTGRSADSEGEKRNPLSWTSLTEKMGFDEKSFIDADGKLIESKIPSVPQFLNRILLLKIADQNEVFSAFERSLEDNVAMAKARDEFDDGMQTLRVPRGGHIEKIEERVAYTDPESKQQTKLVEIERVFPTQYREYQAAAIYSDQNLKFYRNRRTGKVYAAYPSGQRTTSEGGVVRTYRRMGVTEAQQDLIDESDLNTTPEPAAAKSGDTFTIPYQGDAKFVEGPTEQNGNRVVFELRGTRYPYAVSNDLAKSYAQMLYTQTGKIIPGVNEHARYVSRGTYDEIPADQAKAAWEKAMSEADPMEHHRDFFLVGILLPIWKRLNLATPQVFRFETNQGERMLGVRVPSRAVERVLRNLGIAEGSVELTPETIYSQVYREGITFPLSNGWKLARVTVGGQQRIEVVGVEPQDFDRLDEAGAFKERIGFKPRYFIPTEAETGTRVLESILKYAPVVQSTGPLGTPSLRDHHWDTVAVSLTYGVAQGKPGLSIERIRGDRAIVWRDQSGQARGVIHFDGTGITEMAMFDRYESMGLAEHMADFARSVVPTREATGEYSPAVERALRATGFKVNGQGRGLFGTPPVVKGTAAQERIGQRVTGTLEDNRTLFQKFGDFVSETREYVETELKQKLVDRFASIRRLETAILGNADIDASASAYKFARLTGNLASVMEYILRDGPLAYAAGSMTRRAARMIYDDGAGTHEEYEPMGLLEILKPLTESGKTRLWEYYVAAYRANRLMAEGRENNFQTQAEIDELLALGTTHPEFETIRRQYVAFNRAMLDVAQASGLISAAQRATWEKADYVPFYRIMDGMDGKDSKGPYKRRGIANQRSGIRRLKGGENAVAVLENIYRNLETLVDASFKNIAMQRVADLAGAANGLITPIPYQAVPFKTTVAEAVKLMADQGIPTANLTQTELEELITFWRSRAPQGKNVVSVMDQGKARYFRVNDAPLLRSILAMGPDRHATWMKMLMAPKRILTNLVTLDPAFMAANTIRDSLSAWVIADSPIKPGIDSAIGMVKALRHSDSKMRIMAAGGGSGHYNRLTETEVRKQFARMTPDQKKSFADSIIDTPAKVWRAFKDVGRATENANRIAIFDSAKKRGASDAEAAFQALDIMDFGLRGDSKLLNFFLDTVPFLNARLQGLYKLGRASGIGQGTGLARLLPHRRFATHAGMILGGSLALLALNWDNEDYWDLQEWDRDQYYHLWLGGKHYRIPKPFEVGQAFSTVPERMVETAGRTGDTGLLMQRLLSMVRDTFAFNPLPQAIKPIAERAANLNTFTGSPILSEGDRFRAPEQQYGPLTSETVRALAEAMPDSAPEWMRSPKTLEHFIRGYFGTLGMQTLNATDALVREVGDYPEQPSGRTGDFWMVGRFAPEDEGRSTKYVGQFYDLHHEIMALREKAKTLRESGDLAEAAAIEAENRDLLTFAPQAQSAYKTLQSIRQRQNQVYESRILTPEQKREQLTQLGELRNRTARATMDANPRRTVPFFNPFAPERN